MAFAKKTLTVVLLLLALFEVSLGAVHKVGDSDGWTMINVDYNKWSSSRNFHVGDSLLFQYNNQFHDVEQVSHQEFQSCDVISPVATFISGSDTITLNRTGHYYFLCGIPGHCQSGQKLDVLVTPPSLRPIASPAAVPHSSAAPSVLPKDADVVEPSPTQNGAPSLYMPLLLMAISTIVFYASVLV